MRGPSAEFRCRLISSVWTLSLQVGQVFDLTLGLLCWTLRMRGLMKKNVIFQEILIPYRLYLRDYQREFILKHMETKWTVE